MVIKPTRVKADKIQRITLEYCFTKDLFEYDFLIMQKAPTGSDELIQFRGGPNPGHERPCHTQLQCDPHYSCKIRLLLWLAKILELKQLQQMYINSMHPI